MSSYTATTRSNLFAVKDPARFEEWLAEWGELSPITGEADGTPLYGFVDEAGEGLPRTDSGRAERDLIAELAEACQRKGLGLFLYYSYALDWRHPYFYPVEAGWRCARPHYDRPEPSYLWRKDEDFKHYIDFVHAQLRELLTKYGPIAGIWFDPIMGYYARPDLFPIEETYGLIRELQPHCLISFKQGATGDEDFAAPERHAHSLEERVARVFGPEKAAIARRAWERNKDKHIEICATLQTKAWGYHAEADHLGPDQVMEMLKKAREQNANLLLNTGPLGDGSIHPQDRETLIEVGRRLREEGWP